MRASDGPRRAGRQIAAAAGLALLSLVVAGCRHKARTPLERGFGVFMRACAGCHGPDGRGTHPPGFSVPPRDLTDPLLQDRLSDEAIRDTVTHGKGQMPPFGASLSEQELGDVILYVRTLRRGPPAPASSR